MPLHAPTRFARLGDGDRPELLALFERLSDADRRSRFMGGMTEASLAAYVASIDFAGVVTFGAFSQDGTLVAVAEGFVYDDGGLRCLEAAFVTDPAWRRLGLAERLFRSLANDAPRAGVQRIVARCESRNAAMRSLLRATDAATHSEPGEVCASWRLASPAPGRSPVALMPTCDSGCELAFRRSVDVGENQTARRLFATLQHGIGYAGRLVPALATGLLVSIIESVCILELEPHLADEETVVGIEVDVRHLAPALPGRALSIGGSGTRIGREAHFVVVVDDGCERVATARVVLAVIDAERFAGRLAAKAGADACVEVVAA